MHRITHLAILILAATWAALAKADEAVPSQTPSAADADRVARQDEKRILEALSRKISFECADMPIDEAVRQIARAIDCEILIDEKSLSDEGISTDTTVTLKIGEMTAWQMFHFLLEPMLLTWVANDGVLEITTKTHADEVLVTRVHDVHKLCNLLHPLTRDLLFQQRAGKQRPAPPGMMGGMGGGMFSVPAGALSTCLVGQFGGAQPGMPANQVAMGPMSVESILAAMLTQCTSLKWINQDGEGGSIQLGEGCLIVSQSYHGQFEIAGMLQALLKLVEDGGPGKSIAARRIGYPIEEENKIFDALVKPANIRLEADMLNLVIEQIAMSYNLPYWIDLRSLSEEGISDEAQISTRRKMQKVPLGICLKKILEPLQLAWVVDEGVLVFTTQTRADEILFVRFYDISRISKIANMGPDAGVVTILSQSTHGQWKDLDGDGGSARLVSSNHLAVLQSQKVHSEIALLIDDLLKDDLIVPVQPALEIRVYTAPNGETARDLERVIPQLLETSWSARGSIRQAGESLFINQPANVHERIEEILDKLEQSNTRKTPPTTQPKDHNSPQNPQDPIDADKEKSPK